MAQVSRPFQIALVAVLLVLGVWFVALRPKASSESTQSAAPAQSAPSAQSQAQSAAAPTSVYKGAAPGVAGLTSAVAKAHGAVATSQQNAKQLEQNSAKASGEAPSAAASSAAAPASKASSASKPATSSTTSSSTAKSSSSAAAANAPTRQKEVEADLSAGRTSIVLFWDPAGSVDRAVHRQLLLLEGVHHKLRASTEQDLVKRIEKAFALELSVPMSVHVATAKEVASFGTITRGVQVLGTPTMLVIAKSGKAVVIAGLTDAYAIQQAIDEARQG